QPLVDWKIQEGIKTEMVDVATIGNDAASIKNYVTDYYNTHGLTFLLLAGDDAQVATGFVSGAGDSDNQYGYITGSDHYQEIFVGRFSATTGSDITTQVDRTIEYEKNPLVDSYYAKGVCIASEFGAGIGDDGEADYDHERNIRNQLLGYTYTDIQELYDKDHPGGNDASGNPGSADLADLVNSGTGIINYTGHGSETSIVTTGFDNNDVNDLTNVHHWPFLWIVGCVTGDFKNTTCFAEAWARATYNDEPSGSVANFMSTVNQYWAEPMEMQDEGNNLLAEAEADNIKRTFGGLSINGCFSMNDAYGQSGYDMTDTWTIFGDPSLMIRTAEPVSMNITHDLQIVQGSVQFELNCDFDGALVSITRNNIILGTENVSGGVAAVQFENILANVDSVVITVTGFNKLPYIMIIPAIQATGPVLVNTASTINDALGNNNGKADYNEVVSMDITVENVGSATAGNVIAALASINPYISITDDAETLGDITSGAVDDQSAAFSFTVAGNVPDATMADFILTLADDSGGVWTSGITVLLNAPVLTVTSLSIDDASGNNDGKLDPGETVTLNISNSNTGHADAQNTTGILTSSNPYITIYNSNYSFGNLMAGSTSAATYSVSVDANTPFGTDVSFAYTVTAGSYSAALNFISTVTPAIEDFETSDFSQFDWQLSGDEVWKTESYDVFEGTYSARSGNLSSNQSSILTIALNVISDDDISFMMKVSSEPNYDSLTFSIDNVSMGNWSGTIDWSVQSFPVTEGNHTFTWKYQKDGAVNIGYDCAYLDNIFLPAFQSAVNISSANASVDICSYPNPFSQLTFIDYTVKSISDVSVQVFDLNGRLVKTILSNELQAPGQYHLGFDGSSLANGNYYCTFTMGDKTFTEKLVLNK
ncbi:MAG: C25 family cysteine peptidase, partial [Chitinophagales bacterium]